MFVRFLHPSNLFDFHFLTYICGVSFWGNRRPTKPQKETATSIVDAIPEKELAFLITNSKLRDWNEISDIMVVASYK